MFLGLVTSISGLAALAADPRQPTEKWVVSFADAQCMAVRNYGTADNPYYLMFKMPPVGEVLQIGVVRQGQVNEPTQVDGEVIFDDKPPIRTNLFEYGVKQLGQRALLVNLPLRELAAMRGATSISLRTRSEGDRYTGSFVEHGGSSANEQFALRQIGQVLKTLETCAADLRNVWNIEPGGKARLKEAASADLQRLMRADDYPGVAVRRGQSGTVALALLIDEDGKVADCTVSETSGVATLDAQSCAVLKQRAKFKPAIGLDGKAAKSGYVQRITWKLVGSK